jgi:hypothetical protein
MIEALLLLLVVGLLAAGGLVAPVVPVEELIRAGWLCIGAGLALGLPTGGWYHVRLRAALLRSGELPKRWWLRPTPLHARLRPRERPGIMVWFYLGGAGCAVVVLGCVVVGAAVVLAGSRAGVF